MPDNETIATAADTNVPNNYSDYLAEKAAILKPIVRIPDAQKAAMFAEPSHSTQFLDDISNDIKTQFDKVSQPDMLNLSNSIAGFNADKINALTTQEPTGNVLHTEAELNQPKLKELATRDKEEKATEIKNWADVVGTTVPTGTIIKVDNRFKNEDYSFLKNLQKLNPAWTGEYLQMQANSDGSIVPKAYNLATAFKDKPSSLVQDLPGITVFGDNKLVKDEQAQQWLTDQITKKKEADQENIKSGELPFGQYAPSDRLKEANLPMPVVKLLMKNPELYKNFTDELNTAEGGDVVSQKGQALMLQKAIAKTYDFDKATTQEAVDALQNANGIRQTQYAFTKAQDNLVAKIKTIGEANLDPNAINQYQALQAKMLSNPSSVTPEDKKLYADLTLKLNDQVAKSGATNAQQLWAEYQFNNKQFADMLKKTPELLAGAATPQGAEGINTLIKQQKGQYLMNNVANYFPEVGAAEDKQAQADTKGSDLLSVPKSLYSGIITGTQSAVKGAANLMGGDQLEAHVAGNLSNKGAFETNPNFITPNRPTDTKSELTNFWNGASNFADHTSKSIGQILPVIATTIASGGSNTAELLPFMLQGYHDTELSMRQAGIPQNYAETAGLLNAALVGVTMKLGFMPSKVLLAKMENIGMKELIEQKFSPSSVFDYIKQFAPTKGDAKNAFMASMQGTAMQIAEFAQNTKANEQFGTKLNTDQLRGNNILTNAANMAAMTYTLGTISRLTNKSAATQLALKYADENPVMFASVLDHAKQEALTTGRYDINKLNELQANVARFYLKQHGMPVNMNGEQQVAAMNVLDKIASLKGQLENVDPEFKSAIETQIKDQQAALHAIAEDPAKAEAHNNTIVKPAMQELQANGLLKEPIAPKIDNPVPEGFKEDIHTGIHYTEPKAPVIAGTPEEITKPIELSTEETKPVEQPAKQEEVQAEDTAPSFKGLRNDDFAKKYFSTEEYDTWHKLDKENDPKAAEMITAKKESLANKETSPSSNSDVVVKEVIGVPKEFGQIGVGKSDKGFYTTVEIDNGVGKKSTNIDFGKAGETKYFPTEKDARDYGEIELRKKYNETETKQLPIPKEETGITNESSAKVEPAASEAEFTPKKGDKVILKENGIEATVVNSKLQKLGVEYIDKNGNPQQKFVDRSEISKPADAVQEPVKAKGEEKSISVKGKELADKLRKLKTKPDKLQANIFGIPIAIYDGAIETVATSIEKGSELAEAIQKGIAHIKSKGGKVDEEGFAKHIEDFAAGEKPRIKVQVGEGEAKTSGIKHEATAETRGEFGLGEYERSVKKDEELNAQADEEIKKGYDAKKLVQDVEGGKHPSDLENTILKKYISSLEAKVEADPSDENIKELKRTIDATDKIGSEQARALRSRRGLEVRNDSLAGFFINQMDASETDTLTREQKVKNEQEYNDIKAANQEYQDKVDKLEAENAKLKADAEVKKGGKKSGGKKSHEDYVKERKDIIEQMRADLLKAAKGAGGTMSTIPGAPQLQAIAPHVLKLVRSLVEEGVDKLGDVVKGVQDQLKDVVDITDKDVHDIIAGKYNKQFTRNQISEKIKDLRDEAALINKLEALENGIVPTNAKAKIARNKQITELREKIKEHDVTKLSAHKKSIDRQIEKLTEDLANGNYAPQPKKESLLEDANLKKNFPALHKEAMDARNNLIALRQEREVRLLKDKYENRSLREKAVDAISDVANVPRTLMSSVDFSAPLRQGLIATVAHPKIATKAAGKMFQTAFSQKAFDGWFHDLRQSSDWDTIEKSGLYVADPHDPRLSVKEEAFMSNLAEKIPIVGRFVKGSERAYVTYLNKMRVDLFRDWTAGFEAEGKTLKNSPELYKGAASFINNATGRGGMNETLEKAAPLLNSLFFSPRLIASRLNILGLSDIASGGNGFYSKLPKEIRIKALKDLGKFVGVGLSVLALAKLSGAQTEADPRSSDFGKIKVGDTRYDIWGGFTQYIRFFTELITAESKSTETGRINKLDGKGAFGKDRGSVIATFARGKLSPIPSMALDLATGRDAVGQPVTPLSEAITHLSPLLFSDIKEAYQTGGLSSAIPAALASTFGVGVQTHVPKPAKLVPRFARHSTHQRQKRER